MRDKTTIITIASRPPNPKRPGASIWAWRLQLGDETAAEGEVTSIEEAANKASGHLSEMRGRAKFQNQAGSRLAAAESNRWPLLPRGTLCHREGYNDIFKVVHDPGPPNNESRKVILDDRGVDLKVRRDRLVIKTAVAA